MTSASNHFITRTNTVSWTALVLLLVCTLICAPSQAIWFEASGQAVIQGNNKEVARHRATQEAIKQALLFAGASVNSVQRMTNGLLKDDRFEIRASGEVNSIELIDEIYHDDYVTVSIRADIFPQTSSCRAADYKKLITSAWFPVQHKQQASVGSIHHFGQTLVHKLQAELAQYSKHAYINIIEPYYLGLNEDQAALTELASRNNSQFILTGEISDISFTENQGNRLLFWREDNDHRQLTLKLTLLNTTTGERVLNETFSATANWTFNKFKSVDIASEVFWQSDYGKTASQMIQNIAQRFDDTLECLTVYGKVLQVANNQLRINIGQQHGAKVGDRLTLFQKQHFFDQFGQAYQQYQIHPVAVEISQTFPTSAIVKPVDGSLLSNIQTNDFVARR